MGLFIHDDFISHSDLRLPYKIDCDTLTDDDITALAQIILSNFAFKAVIGVPRGGLRLAAALRPYCVPGYPTLIVDDVLTTGKSMEEWRAPVPGPVIGVVVFARGPVPNWVWPMFIAQEWTQSRGTGTG